MPPFQAEMTFSSIREERLFDVLGVDDEGCADVPHFPQLHPSAPVHIPRPFRIWPYSASYQMSNILGADPVYGRTQEDAVIIDRRLFAETLPPSSADEDDDNADPDGEEYRDAIRRSTAMVLDDSNEFSSPPTSSQIDRLDSPTENTRNPWMSSLVDSAFDRNHPHSMLRSTMLMHDMLRTLIEHTRRLSVRMMNKHRLGNCIPSLVLKQMMSPMRCGYNH